jgi:glycosyltransferase involved in cell wall biosynthesis
MATSYGIGLTYHLTRLSIGLKAIGHDVFVISEPREQVSGLSVELARAGIKHYTSDHIDKRTVFDVYCSAREIRKILESEKIDVVHAQGCIHAMEAHLARRLMRSSERPSIVTTVHNVPDMSRLDHPKWIAMVSILDKCSDLVIPVSHNTNVQLTRHKLNPEKMVTVHNAIDLKVFDAHSRKSELGPKTEKKGAPVFLCGGNLISRKGHDYYLKAAAELLKNSSAEFYVVGDGPRRKHLEELVLRLGIEKQVVFTGFVSWPEMYHLLTSVADICVSASLSELFPYYVLECMAAGKPIVATNVGGVSEAVINELNGYIVPPRDLTSLANAMLKLVNDSNKAEAMGKNSRAMAEKEFDLPEMVSNLSRCYELSLTRKRSTVEKNRSQFSFAALTSILDLCLTFREKL